MLLAARCTSALSFYIPILLHSAMHEIVLLVLSIPDRHRLQSSTPDIQILVSACVLPICTSPPAHQLSLPRAESLAHSLAAIKSISIFFTLSSCTYFFFFSSCNFLFLFLHLCMHISDKYSFFLLSCSPFPRCTCPSDFLYLVDFPKLIYKEFLSF